MIPVKLGVPKVGTPKISTKPITNVNASDQSFGLKHPSFKFRVRPAAMMTAYPSATKPIAYKQPSLKGAYA